jgi:hypothetical protein
VSIDSKLMPDTSERPMTSDPSLLMSLDMLCPVHIRSTTDFVAFASLAELSRTKYGGGMSFCTPLVRLPVALERSVLVVKASGYAHPVDMLLE